MFRNKYGDLDVRKVGFFAFLLIFIALLVGYGITAAYHPKPPPVTGTTITKTLSTTFLTPGPTTTVVSLSPTTIISTSTQTETSTQTTTTTTTQTLPIVITTTAYNTTTTTVTTTSTTTVTSTPSGLTLKAAIDPSSVPPFTPNTAVLIDLQIINPYSQSIQAYLTPTLVSIPPGGSFSDVTFSLQSNTPITSSLPTLSYQMYAYLGSNAIAGTYETQITLSSAYGTSSVLISLQSGGKQATVLQAVTSSAGCSTSTCSLTLSSVQSGTELFVVGNYYNTAGCSSPGLAVVDSFSSSFSSVSYSSCTNGGVAFASWAAVGTSGSDTVRIIVVGSYTNLVFGVIEVSSTGATPTVYTGQCTSGCSPTISTSQTYTGSAFVIGAVSAAGGSPNSCTTTAPLTTLAMGGQAWTPLLYGTSSSSTNFSLSCNYSPPWWTEIGIVY